MQQIADCEGVEQKRIFGLAGLSPAETVLPEIAERIAQQFNERCCRLLTLKGRCHDGMITADESVVWGQPPGVPVDPAGPGSLRLRQGLEFVRAGEQPIRPSRCMFRYAGALTVDFG